MAVGGHVVGGHLERGHHLAGGHLTEGHPVGKVTGTATAADDNHTTS